MVRKLFWLLTGWGAMPGGWCLACLAALESPIRVGVVQPFGPSPLQQGFYDHFTLVRLGDPNSTWVKQAFDFQYGRELSCNTELCSRLLIFTLETPYSTGHVAI